MFVFLLLACNYFPVVFNHIVMAFYGRPYKHTCHLEEYETYNERGVTPAGVNSSAYDVLHNNISVESVEYGVCESTYHFSDGRNRSVDCVSEEGTKWKFDTLEGQSSIVTEVYTVSCSIFRILFFKWFNFVFFVLMCEMYINSDTCNTKSCVKISIHDFTFYVF